MLHYRALPARLASALAAGLPARSRSKLRLAGERLPDETQLLAAAVDALQRIEWRLIGCPGGRPPRSVLAALTGAEHENAGGVQGFGSPQEFEAALAALKGADENGGRD